MILAKFRSDGQRVDRVGGDTAGPPAPRAPRGWTARWLFFWMR
jgi:hypothetical protein